MNLQLPALPERVPAILKRYYVLPRRYWPDNPIA